MPSGAIPLASLRHLQLDGMTQSCAVYSPCCHDRHPVCRMALSVTHAPFPDTMRVCGTGSQRVWIFPIPKRATSPHRRTHNVMKLRHLIPHASAPSRADC